MLCTLTNSILSKRPLPLKPLMRDSSMLLDVDAIVIVVVTQILVD